MRAEGRAAAPAGCSRYTEKRPLETDPPSDAAPDRSRRWFRPETDEPRCLDRVNRAISRPRDARGVSASPLTASELWHRNDPLLSAISGCDRRGLMLTRKRFQGRSYRRSRRERWPPESIQAFPIESWWPWKFSLSVTWLWPRQQPR